MYKKREQFLFKTTGHDLFLCAVFKSSNKCADYKVIRIYVSDKTITKEFKYTDDVECDKIVLNDIEFREYLKENLHILNRYIKDCYKELSKDLPKEFIRFYRARLNILKQLRYKFTNKEEKYEEK